LRPLDGIFTPPPELLAGLGDDAALWRLDADRALVVTTDFFTPVVDTPYEYGAIAAANSLSDVYAVGGQPFLALNIANMPANLPTDIVGEILRGGAEKVKEAGAVIAGGHTIQDDEPKYGLVVLGFVHPEKALTKRGARPGDALILTKPLGFGVTTTALKNGEIADPEHVTEAIGWMSQLNAGGAALAREFDLRAGTDITGFSLLGHGWEMAHASGVGFRLFFSQIPFISCARHYAEQGTFPGGSADNKLHFSRYVNFQSKIDVPSQMLLFDAQTSGGLLLSVPRAKLDDLLAHAQEMDQPAWVLGEVIEVEQIEVGR